MNKKERYKKLFRKVRKAKRQGEPYEHWLEDMDRLDVLIAQDDKKWVMGVHRQKVKGATASV